MAILTYVPDWGPSPDLQPRVLKAQFGDGYDQRAANGLNDLLPTWNLVFSRRTQTEAVAIASWFATNRAHVTAFEWAAPGDSTAAGELFGTGDGSRVAWQLTSGGMPVTSGFGTPTIYRTDWQGTVTLSPNPRSNLLSRSQEFDISPWSRNAAGTASVPVVTANYGVAPDGSNTADRVVFALNGGVTTTDQSNLQQSGIGLIGAVETVSLWLKTTDGSTKKIRLEFASSIGQTITVTGAWTRFVVSGTSAGSTGFWLRLRGAHGTDDSADLLLWGAQFEIGPVATPYIPTTTASVTVTDYTLSSTGLVTLATAPVNGAALTWSGSYTRKFIADKWTPAKPDDYGSWSVTASLRMVPA